MQILIKFLRWFTTDKTHPQKISLDYSVLFSALLLLTIGVVMVYSASVAYAASDSGVGNQYYYLTRHIIAISLGMVAGVGVFIISSGFWQRKANWIIIIVFFGLTMVLIPHVGSIVNGSRRWLHIPFMPLNIQPSEFAKLGVTIYLANYFCGKKLEFKKFTSDVLPFALTLTVVLVLLLVEPDMGSATVVFIIALTISYLSGMDMRGIYALLIIGVVSFIMLVVFEPYRMKRVLGFINPWGDSLGKGYQLSHSLLAFGHGSWFGVGLGNSIEKWFYLPEAHTDFIMAIIGEEFGVVGVCAVLILFWVIFYRGFNLIANEAKRLPGRKFQTLLAQGISVWFFGQAIVNIGVTIGLLPTKGLTLPFISYGGSSILVNCIAIALLLKIDFENKLIKYGLQKK